MKRVDFAKGVVKKRVEQKDLLPNNIGNIGDSYMGIDWGMRDDPTVICLIRQTEYGSSCLYHEISANDIQAQVNFISEFIERMNPRCVVADIGFGNLQCQMLQQRFGDRVKTCYYTNNHITSYNAETWMLSVNREQTLAESETLVKSPLTDNERHALNYANLARRALIGDRAIFSGSWVQVPGDTI